MKTWTWTLTGVRKTTRKSKTNTSSRKNDVIIRSCLSLITDYLIRYSFITVNYRRFNTEPSCHTSDLSHDPSVVIDHNFISLYSLRLLFLTAYSQQDTNMYQRASRLTKLAHQNWRLQIFCFCPTDSQNPQNIQCEIKSDIRGNYTRESKWQKWLNKSRIFHRPTAWITAPVRLKRSLSLTCSWWEKDSRGRQ